MKARNALNAALLLTGLSGCAAGPDFMQAKAPDVPRYTRAAQPTQTGSAAGVAQSFSAGAKISADWWRLFQSPALDSLVKEALASNLTLEAARARLTQAQEVLEADYGALYPQLTGSLGAQRQRTPAVRFGTMASSTIFNLYTGSVGVSYALDFFGYSRRTLEREQANLENQRMQLRAAQLTLTANVINAAFLRASLAAQIAATQGIIRTQQSQQSLVGRQYQAGLVPYSDVLSLQSQLAASEATLPSLQQRLSQASHLLATYLGRPPAMADLPEIRLADFRLPAALPLSLPSELVRQRPDILAAEAQLKAANAQVGVATAALYPRFTLNASYGQNSLKLASLFDSANSLWTLAANLSQPLFDGGTLRAQKRQAEAAYREALANYKQTLITSFAQVADVLRALENDADSLRIQQQSAQYASQASNLVNLRYKAGKASYLDLLSAQRQEQQTRIALVQAQAQRYQDSAALFTALGGGWWQNPEAADKAAIKTGS
ncbi:RND transporter [Sulfuriferula plumbiphila]|uniref:RND transporter n=1 Tax=Sulfuriferula plumbiphila TaxID=171865 RepID=A0A512L6D8_9PROT|nr:efflux transporter outer membrane subunit [Sulfuriferula plumbiphila]BBP03498.1 RND transporter [Sulfuriferula plumbiphila]GEP29731.1 RND transporter [Sulfuriferula plumbiphila]